METGFKIDKEDLISSGTLEHPVFYTLNDKEVMSIIPYFTRYQLAEGQFLMEEGERTPIELYLVLSGKVHVIRKADLKPSNTVPWFVEKDFIIAALSAGDTIGELSFAKGGVRSATVQCIEKAELLGLSIEQYERLEDSHPRLASRLMKNLVGTTGGMLKKTTDNEINALKMELQNSAIRSKANLFFSYVIGLLCVYNLGLQQIIDLSANSSRTSLLSAAIILVFCGALVLMIRQSGLPPHFFGLTVRNWKPALKESILWSAIIVAVLVVAKWTLVTYVSRYHHLPVISFDPSHTRFLVFNFALYGLHSPVQEFIVRGVLQGSLQNFFKGRRVTSRAILISNAIFSATHVHLLGGLLGAIVFVPGLFWGWMYARQQNLIGVSISHILIGWTALFFLDLESLF